MRASSVLQASAFPLICPSSSASRFRNASLYILGDLQLIDSLKALALFKLHRTLCVFQLDDGNAEDIIALARYAYSEEGGGGALDKGISRCA
jgi:hypothetical protein